MPRNHGVSLLSPEDRIVPDRELAEKLEPLNLRTADMLDLALAEVLQEAPGGFLSNKLYYVTNPLNSRPDEVMFDRFYFSRKLLVDMKPEPNGTEQRAQYEADRIKKLALADEYKLKYLQIVGSASLEQIAEAVR